VGILIELGDRKMVKSKLLIVMLVAVLLSVAGISHGKEDSQIWSDASLSLRMSDYWKFTFSEEFRFNDGDSIYHHSDVGISTDKLFENVEVGLNYRLYYHRKGSGEEWKQVHSPHFNFTYKSDLFELPISNRSRFQFLDNEEGLDYWKYRNKTTLKLDKLFTIYKFKPYVSNEIFVSLTDDTQINRNRLSAGLTYKLSKNVDMKMFYLWQSSKKNKEWLDMDVLGFSFKLKF
jgi:hypothetical protein